MYVGLMAPATSHTTLLVRAYAALLQGAEYSLRWDPTQGGPATPAAAIKRLGLKVHKTQDYQVEYFDIALPAGTPEGFDAIVRRRQSDTETELTYKLRGGQPLPAAPNLKNWDCPLPSPNKRKDEIDVTFLADALTQTAFSRSCSHASGARDLAVPAALQARPKGCSSRMHRLASKHLKVERWQMADGSTLIEASWLGTDRPRDRDRFQREVVTPLLGAGAVPMNRSKSAIGGECTK
jgi:hypothetical protein